MSKAPPTLALDLTGEAASLHQLAFDGHWHEMARAGFNEIGLAEKMAFMRRVAVRLEGRMFRNTVWLPNEQIIERKLKLASTDPATKLAEAKLALSTITSHPAEDFLVELAEKDEAGYTPVVAVRKTTLAEARRFATSHGFRAESFTVNRDAEGFSEPVRFIPPRDVQALRKQAVLVAGFAAAAALVLAGAWWADPLGWRSPAPVEIAAQATPVADPIATAQPNEDPVVAAPAPTESTAIAPELLDDLTAPEIAARVEEVVPDVAAAVDEPTPDSVQEVLTEPAADRDLTPIAGEPDVASSDVAVAELEADTPIPAEPEIAAVADPVQIAAPEIAQVELLPETNPNETTALADGTAVETVMPETAETLAAESAVEPAIADPIGETVDVAAAETLRRGFAIPPPESEISAEVAPEPAPESEALVVAREPGENPLDALAAATPLPEIQPQATTATVNESAALEYVIIEGLPPFTLRLRSGNDLPQPSDNPVQTAVEISTPEVAAEVAAAEPEVAPSEVANPETADQAAIDDANIVDSRPGFEVLLRAGTPQDEPATPVEADAEAEVQDLATNATTPLPEVPVVTDEASAEIASAAETTTEVAAIDLTDAEAARLRPARRPAEFAELAVAAEDIISGAAPRTANRAARRSADFAARIAPLITARAAEATASGPAIPPEPQAVALPTRASVARAATIENAINLREVALIGIYGTADNRRALVRLASGRYIRLTLGETFSGGWRIVAMDDSSIRVQKGNRTEILRISGG